MNGRKTSDLERAGLRIGDAEPHGRSLLATVDFEAFRAWEIGRWRAAMLAWAGEASRRNFCAVFFVSIEHVVRLRAADEHAYEQLLDGLTALTHSGVELQPHNHCAFDRETGSPLRSEDLPSEVPGYWNPPSMFFDVVHRNGIPIGEWIPDVVSALDELRSEVQHPAAPFAFRPGGWDSGGRSDELADYVAALSGGGVSYDSSATRGTHGTLWWRVGLPFGRNVFRLAPSVVEVAATMGWTCGSRVAPATAGAALRLLEQPRAYLTPARRGVLSPVLHFDHIVRSAASASGAADQARWVVRTLARLASVLRMRPSTFGSLELGGPEGPSGDLLRRAA